MDLTGYWHFFEQFDSGFDLGYAIFRQEDGRLTGIMVYTEYIYDEGSFVISVDVEGDVFDDRLMLRGNEYEIVETEYPIEYLLDDRIAELNNPYKIEGQSVDEQDLEGRFVLRRIFASKA